MKTTAKNAIREESGKILILVLVLLVVGGLLLGPLLGLMSTGLVAGQVYEKKAAELYAADAGVEEAIWRISNNITGNGDPFFLEANGREVVFTIDGSGCGSGRRYVIESTATTQGASSTTVQARIFRRTVWDNALATRETVGLKQDTTIIGDVWSEEGFDPPDDLDHDGIVVDDPNPEDWPSQAEIDVFAQELKNEALVGGTWEDENYEIPMNAVEPLGPLYIPGDLTIEKNATVNLQGTIYVGGSIEAYKNADIVGSGSIVAVGSIKLFKLSNWGAEGDNTIMSITGDIEFKKEDGDIDQIDIRALIFAPNGTVTFNKETHIYGAVVAKSTIASDKGLTVVYDERIGERGDLPGMGRGQWKILTWEIS